MEYEESERIDALSGWQESLPDDVHIRVSKGDVYVFSLFDGREQVAGPYTRSKKDTLIPYARGYSKAKKKFTEQE